MAAITISSHENLLKSLQAAGHYLPAICGRRGVCGKCAVRVISGFLPISSADRNRFSTDELEKGWRLACTAFPENEITVELPETGELNFSVLNHPEQKNSFTTEPGTEKSPETGKGKSSRRIAGKAFGIAIDIGTTTIGCAMIELATGKIAARYSTVNRQREYGADLVSRIQSANDGNLLQLSSIARTQISEGISILCAETAAACRDIEKIVITGNTLMLHILLNLSCRGLGQAPFTPVTLEMLVLPYRELFDGNLNCELVILPGISTYIGADICAGIFFTGIHTSTAPAALVDIGTNGEMALAYKGKILCAATAAGPAFEGGNILWGTGSVPGAISHMRFHNGVFELSTIDDKPPAGICGSGLIDIVYQGFVNDLILSTGKFSRDCAEGFFLAKTPDGRDIVFCQKDLRELQLAKSAIRSGLDALLNHAGLAYNDIHTLYIAGGFGFNLNLESAAGIGLIPAALLPKVSLAGNSALGGAVKYLLGAVHGGNSSDYNEQLRYIIRQSLELSLSEDQYFRASFITNINFSKPEEM